MVDAMKKNKISSFINNRWVSGVVVFLIYGGIVVLILLALNLFFGDNRPKNNKTTEDCRTDTYGGRVDVEVCSQIQEPDYDL